MAQLPLPQHANFSLEDHGWHGTDIGYLSQLFDEVISKMFGNLESQLLSTIDVHIVNEFNQEGAPQIFLDWCGRDTILLNRHGICWDSFIYEFSHELCHHVIRKTDFGWLEETLCELASLYMLDALAKDWKFSHDPRRSGYWKALQEYAAKQPHYHMSISAPIHKFIQDDWNLFLNDRYRRAENMVVAKALLPTFIHNPALWGAVQYLCKVRVANCTLRDIFDEWRKLIPSNLEQCLGQVERMLTGVGFDDDHALYLLQYDQASHSASKPMHHRKS